MMVNDGNLGVKKQTKKQRQYLFSLLPLYRLLRGYNRHLPALWSWAIFQPEPLFRLQHI